MVKYSEENIDSDGEESERRKPAKSKKAHTRNNSFVKKGALGTRSSLMTSRQSLNAGPTPQLSSVVATALDGRGKGASSARMSRDQSLAKI